MVGVGVVVEQSVCDAEVDAAIAHTRALESISCHSHALLTQRRKEIPMKKWRRSRLNEATK